MTLSEQYILIRKQTERICAPLQTEDYVVQPVVDVSPPKWHLGHTTWFFEAFVLVPSFAGYQMFNPNFNYLFNSYYETVGNRVIRTDRGNLSRPGVDEIYRYRTHVDNAMLLFLQGEVNGHVEELLFIGFNHEQQHQELLLTDIKYILGHNPLFPPYRQIEKKGPKNRKEIAEMRLVPEGMYEIGYTGDGFCFDNELSRHKVYLQAFSISSALVSNGEYLQFMSAGGYTDFNFWHSEGWDWVRNNDISAPMYWHHIDGDWYCYTLEGLRPLDPDAVLTHVSYYEAYAFAQWRGMRLPTEFEWEAAAGLFDWGARWEWTESAYLPYPGFSKAPGAIGEYNGKFMVNQKVLRGGSIATAAGHSRNTYRNFFHPQLRWQFTGIRLVK
ncbi:ergothioneine biosynthesis protein EgtB [Pedobacter sp. JY14-1]|uniref:ergothioneine biosynthesis protein EgtB n=1 Tax=Pedobacter sp. JY14-1 TaxID=3034151 RepID=UPI0023E33317|nr:ergothioneine biosynthesis protein EgtB [Pedobacter sp. JY14-1]